MAHKFTIEQNKKGEYVAKFSYNGELIWWTEGYSAKASAKNAIESILKNGPGALEDGIEEA
ncbi:MAG: YegP family protein [Pseudomonadota bacterium]